MAGTNESDRVTPRAPTGVTGGARAPLGLAEALTRAQRQTVRVVTAALREDGCSFDEWRVLRALADGEGHLMGAVAEELVLPQPTLTRLIDGLVDRALVYRRQSDEDRRRVGVHLSRQGRARLERLDAAVEAREEALRATPAWRETRALLGAVLDG